MALVAPSSLEPHAPVGLARTDGIGRIRYLDGLRGLAIILVLLYHAYVRWAELLPFGKRFANFPLFTYGWLGVHLFFIISGFVILMTLEKCRSFPDFIARRWLRLFPAMLACSALVFVTSPAFPERPAGLPTSHDLLSGLTFIEPNWWSKLLGTHQGLLEGAFWSLFVEVKFYVIFGFLFFTVGRTLAIAAIALLFALNEITTLAMLLAPGAFHPAQSIHSLFHAMSAKHYGWFAAGALFYLYQVERRKGWLVVAIVVAVAASASTAGLSAVANVCSLFIVILFAWSILSGSAQLILSHPALLFMGFISYPLYLVHENMMVALMVKLGHWMPLLPPILFPVVPIAFVIAIAWVVASFVEDRLRHVLQSPYRLFRG